MNQPVDPDAPYVPPKGLTAEGLWWLMLLFAFAAVGAAVVLVLFGRGAGVASPDLRTAAQVNPGHIAPLINAGADPNEIDPYTGETALSVAITYHNDESVKLLLEHGADPNLCGTSGVAPLVSPYLHYNDPVCLQIIQLLLDHGADVAVQDSLHQTPLHRAAEAGNLRMLEQILAAGADIDALSDVGTALHVARFNGHDPVADFLIRAGADDTIPIPGGTSGTLSTPFTGPGVHVLPALPSP